MHPGSVDIRLLTTADAGVLDRVEDGVFDNAVRHALAARYLATPNNHLVVAIADEFVVGMASAIAYVHPDKPLQLYINEVGVADRMQGCGIGKRLVRRLLELARCIGCNAVWVATEEGNRAARALYTSLNGREDPERAVVYTWRLAVAGRADQDPDS
jgi:aminoglycoside 6'-N-acetyltransferase I